MNGFRPVRRQDRLLDIPAAERLLEKGEYGFLAMCIPEGYGYGIPISYVYVPDRKCIYFHCAPQGHKLDAIAGNDRVSFCVVGGTQVYPYTTAYESVHVFGRIGTVGDDAERMEALLLLRAKYNPELADAPDGYIRKSFPRTTVLRLDVEHLSGKCKRVAPDVK
ncbi:pyridoxamine 5'-phosphate oxidase family protein [uncultured Rikenella sp.]|uniref:pyridoxamine 5'-phosphate oxidase family protein n=1 Tax=uncultured Rikenella sp. TaxID=368003 RepID=UPI002631F6EF|nr:pyridoxamine 5'-phosphate oxidase family protein [uncultured Rikenella sp.]